MDLLHHLADFVFEERSAALSPVADLGAVRVAVDAECEFLRNGQHVDFKELLRMEPDGGITNIRNTSSAQWKRWLALDQRPFAGLAQSPNTWCNST